MEYIKGKYKSSIFESESGYKVGLFRVKETNITDVEMNNKTITFTGYFADLNEGEKYIHFLKNGTNKPAVEVLKEIEGACGIKMTAIVNNSNIGRETTESDVLSSFAKAEKLSQKVVEILEQKRIERNITKLQISKETGISRTAITLIANKQNSPTLRTLLMIASSI